jgi:hypothetical protein
MHYSIFVFHGKRAGISYHNINNLKKEKQIKPLQHIFNISTREAADEQMRDRFVSLPPLIVTPKLHGISAFSKKLSENLNQLEYQEILNILSILHQKKGGI